MWIESLFFIIFAMQIFLISYYYPKKVKQRMDYVYENCPFETHSKMYPGGYEKALRGKFTFSLVSNIILLIGLAVLMTLVYVIFNSEKTLDQFSFVPLAYGMTQAIPLVLLEISGFRQFKQMRALNHDTVRSAELNPRSLFTFITPLQLFFAIGVAALCVFLVFMFNDFVLNELVLTLIISLILSNTLFFVLGYKLVYGKKFDPHQSVKDRHISTQVALRSFVSVSMLISVFFIFTQAAIVYSLDMWEPIFNSVYWLLVMILGMGSVLKNVNLKDINFDVYKTPTQAETDN